MYYSLWLLFTALISYYWLVLQPAMKYLWLILSQRKLSVLKKMSLFRFMVALLDSTSRHISLHRLFCRTSNYQYHLYRYCNCFWHRRPRFHGLRWRVRHCYFRHCVLSSSHVFYSRGVDVGVFVFGVAAVAVLIVDIGSVVDIVTGKSPFWTVFPFVAYVSGQSLTLQRSGQVIQWHWKWRL